MIRDVLTTFDKVKMTRSRTEKEVLIKICKDKPLMQKLFKYAYDWRLSYGLTSDGFDHLTGRDYLLDGVDDEAVEDFFTVLDRLASRQLTGMEARVVVQTALSTCAVQVQWVLKRILNRHLELGIAAKSVHKIFPGLITLFGVQLCEPLDMGEIAKELAVGRWIVEPKLDGVRSVIGKHNGVSWSAVSREGNELFNCEHIVEQLKAIDPEGKYIWDGELRSQSFHHTVSTVHSGIATGVPLKFNVFDVVPADLFPNCVTPLHDRRTMANLLLLDSRVDREVLVDVPMNHLNHTLEVETLLSHYIELGFEGIVLKDLDSPYTPNRNKAWRKMKVRETHDYTIMSALEGTGKDAGRLGSLVIDVDGQECRVGSGFTDFQREEYWENLETIVGKTVEVAFQERTPAGVLRFPVFVRMREDK